MKKSKVDNHNFQWNKKNVIITFVIAIIYDHNDDAIVFAKIQLNHIILSHSMRYDGMIYDILYVFVLCEKCTCAIDLVNYAYLSL